MECSMAFEKVPRRGLEIGGILLGRSASEENTTTFWIDGFLAVDSEHRLGPSYLLSESDLGHLQHQLDVSGDRCVGIYRSQTRAKQLSVDESDVQLCGQCFQGRPSLFLMLAPALGRAAFFIRADGNMECIGEFALPAAGTTLSDDGNRRRHQRPRLAPPRPGLARRESPHDPPTQQGALHDRHPALPAEVPAPSRYWKWRYAAALIAILFFVTGVGGLIPSFAARAGRDLSASRLVALKIQPLGSTLRILWDPSSAALRGANRVVLHVRDGDYEGDRDLLISEVRSGTTVYQPRSEDVFFRLDVYSGAPTAAGSVRVIGASRNAGKAPSLKQSGTNVLAAPTPVNASPPRQENRVQLIPKSGDVSDRWLGMSLRPVTRDEALASQLPQTYGLLITHVDPLRSASGLESGDILVALNGQRIADARELKLKIAEMNPATTPTLAVFRHGEIHQLEVNFGKAGGAAQTAAADIRPGGTSVIVPPGPR